MYYIISTYVNSDALLPHMHAQGVKQSVLSVICLLSVCLSVVNTKIARSRHLGICENRKHKE